MDGELFGQMVDAVGVGVGAYNSDGEYVYVNQAYAEMLDTDRESLLGTTIWEINEDVDSDRFEEYWSSYTAGETRTAEAIHRYGTASVDVQTLTTRVSAGGESYNVGTIQDISLRKTRERQLSQLHAVTKELIEADSSSGIAQIVADTVKNILGYEYNVVRLLNDSGHLEPVAVTEKARPDIGDSWSYSLDEETAGVRAFKQGQPVRIENITSLSDGYDRGNARSVLYVPVGRFGLLSIAHPESSTFDETDVDLASILTSNADAALRRLENERDLERQNERLEAFVDVISHDIPNHLNVADMRLDLARQQEDLSQLNDVASAHSRIESVISDMRKLVDHGEQINSVDWLSFEDTVGNCWSTCHSENKDVSLEVESSGLIQADESRLKQLLENLLWNALEHAGSAPTIRVGLMNRGFYVEDDGPGIPDSERQKVLSPGYTSSDGEAHFGFGLAIVREVVRAHGWTLDVTESAAGGARFEITGVTLSREGDETLSSQKTQ